jgi:Glycosyltransferase 61
MSDANSQQKILTRLKRLGPVYQSAKRIRRRARNAFFTSLRHTLPPWPRFGPAKGLFHAYEELRAGQLPGEILLAGQIVKPIASDSLRLRAKLGQEGHQPWPIFWTQHAAARLIGDTGLLVDSHKRVCAEALYRIHLDGEPDYHTLWLPPPIKLAGNWTSILYRWSSNYYHWLTDCLPRLALLNRLPTDTRILVPANLKPFQLETLRWLGLADRIQAAPGRHLILENYFFSTPTAMTGCANPYAVKFLREKFLSHPETSFAPAEKIYIQRRSKTRGLLNETEVTAFLENRGWRTVDLEALTLPQQVQLFSKARAVCGLHGAGFTNLLWCQPGCIAVELFAENFLNGCYESLASCVEVEHRFLIHPADESSRIKVDLGQLELILSGC